MSENLSLSFPQLLRRRLIHKESRALSAAAVVKRQMKPCLVVKGRWLRAPRIPEMKDICKDWFSADGQGDALTQPGLFSIITRRVKQMERDLKKYACHQMAVLFLRLSELHL